MTDEYDFEGRKPGRPKTGRGEKLGTRIAPDLRDRVQDYADANFTDFHDAVRRLIEKGLPS